METVKYNMPHELFSSALVFIRQSTLLQSVTEHVKFAMKELINFLLEIQSVALCWSVNAWPSKLYANQADV